jgi:hypothetical protein
MPGEQEQSPPGKGPEEQNQGRVPEKENKARLLEWLDVGAKLMGAAAVLVVAIIANSFQSKLTGVSIQTQREQAESQLRANMFSSLINPLAGPQQNGKMIEADREELLAELLALNFYENFELKPLLQDVSGRLARETNVKQNSSAPGSDPREHLWSISRRISERQKASIAWEWQAAEADQARPHNWLGRLFGWVRPARQSGAQGCQFYAVTVVQSKPPSSAQSAERSSKITEATECAVPLVTFKNPVRLKSPDKNYTLQLTAVKADWKNQTVEVSASPFLTKQRYPSPTDLSYSFQLSWFDFPLTDNTLLPDGNRFAVYLRAVSTPSSAPNAAPGRLTMVVMWFPKGYFTPRERPLNYREVQDLLGRKTQ